MAICPYAVHYVFVAWEEPTDDLFYKEATSLSVLLCFLFFVFLPKVKVACILFFSRQ